MTQSAKKGLRTTNVSSQEEYSEGWNCCPRLTGDALLFLPRVSRDVMLRLLLYILAPITVFSLLELTETAFLQWYKFSTLDKLKYLLDDWEVENLRMEFDQHLSRDAPDASAVTLDTFEAALAEFQDLQTIRKFLTECDANNSGTITFEEYIICRGDFDKYGNPGNTNEYEHRASTLLMDYEMELRASSRPMPGVKYDERGIIID